jgi:dephospho-CoA kinase
MRSFRLGITGKIGSGKSVFSGLLREQGITVLDTDTIAKEVMVSDAELRSDLISLFGPDAYAGNKLNTSFLASQIFTDEEKRLSVERIVHPKVSKLLEENFTSAKAGTIVAVESALLLQTGYDEIFDALILISSSDKSVIERNKTVKKFTEEDLLARLHDQAFSKEDEADADFTIINDSTLEQFIEGSRKVIAIITVMAMGELPKEPLRSIIDEEEL